MGFCVAGDGGVLVKNEEAMRDDAVGIDLGDSETRGEEGHGKDSPDDAITEQPLSVRGWLMTSEFDAKRHGAPQCYAEGSIGCNGFCMSRCNVLCYYFVLPGSLKIVRLPFY